MFIIYHDDERGSPTYRLRRNPEKLPSTNEKTVGRLSQEITVIITAGSDSVARILQNAMFHLVVNPEVLARLRTEIIQVMPEIYSTPSVKTLKELPWLVSPAATYL